MSTYTVGFLLFLAERFSRRGPHPMFTGLRTGSLTAPTLAKPTEPRRLRSERPRLTGPEFHALRSHDCEGADAHDLRKPRLHEFRKARRLRSGCRESQSLFGFGYAGSGKRLPITAQLVLPTFSLPGGGRRPCQASLGRMVLQLGFELLHHIRTILRLQVALQTA